MELCTWCSVRISVYHIIMFLQHIICLYNTGSVDVNIEAVSALSNAHQLNNCLVVNSMVECSISDGASDDRAVKCCISNHYHHNGRRRLVVVEATAIDNQCYCMNVHKCLAITYKPIIIMTI